MRYITDKKAAELSSLPTDAADREQVLVDAGRVLLYVRRNEFISEDELRAYGERNDLGPDRMNAALAFLRETGQLLVLPESRVLPLPPEPVLSDPVPVSADPPVPSVPAPQVDPDFVWRR